MRKIQILGAFVAVLAFSALAVASASATLWLKNGASLTVELTVQTHGTVLLHHKGGFGGEALIECRGLFDGKVGPGAQDKVELVLNLAGSESDLIKCIRLNGAGCPAEPIVHAGNLPWSTELALVGGLTVDKFLGEPLWQALCTLAIDCKGPEEAHFKENGPNGAIFEYLGVKENSCDDGGKGTILGLGEVLGFTVS